MKKIINVKYSVDRKEKYQIKTVIYEEANVKYVTKEAYTNKAFLHVESIYDNYKLLSNTNMNIVKSEKVGDSIRFPFIEGEDFAQLLLKDIKLKDLNKFESHLLLYKKLIKNEKIERFILTESFIKVFGLIEDIEAESHAISNIDLNFENIIVNDDKFYIIDYEWVFNFPIPLDYIIYRAIKQFFERYISQLKNFISIESVLEILEVNKSNLHIFDKMEDNFRKRVAGGWVKQRRAYHKPIISRTELLEKDINGFNQKKDVLQIFWSKENEFTESKSESIIVNNLTPNYSVRIPSEEIQKFRVDPGSKSNSLVKLKLVLENEDEELNLLDYLTESVGVYIMSNTKIELQFVTLTNDPQLIFNHFDFNKYDFMNIEISFHDNVKEISNELLKFINIKSKEFEQQRALFLDSEKTLNKKIEEKQELISNLQQKNDILEKVNNEILNSKKWKIMNFFRFR